MHNTNDIRGFSGDYRFLSNFYVCQLEVDGVLYDSSEHYYMSQNTTDSRWRDLIISASSPSKSKELGKKAPLRKDWEEKYKNQSMMCGLMAKFDNDNLRQKLIATGDAYLEETNHWGDTYWGVCNGEGKNMLGRMLMYVRDKYVAV